MLTVLENIDNIKLIDQRTSAGSLRDNKSHFYRKEKSHEMWGGKKQRSGKVREWLRLRDIEGVWWQIQKTGISKVKGIGGTEKVRGTGGSRIIEGFINE